MTIFDPARGRIIDGGGGRGVLRLAALGIAAFLLVILFFNSVTRVATGRVGVLTLFGRVTGETLGEGIHVINPLKTNMGGPVGLSGVMPIPSSAGVGALAAGTLWTVLMRCAVKRKSLRAVAENNRV